MDSFMNSIHAKILVKTLQDSFEGRPWYGISVMEKLDTLNWRFVGAKPFGYSKSVAMLVGHMIRWRVFVLKKLQGDQDFDIEINSVEDWPKIEIYTEDEWNRLLLELQQTQLKLVQVVSERDETFLASQVPGRNYNFHFLIKGISEHDIYHLGQIALLYRLVNPY